MEKKIGFIGCGNMGTAMIQGILESGKCPPQEMMISCRTKKTLEEKKAQFGVQISTDTVSYTHLDVYKRQGMRYVFYLNDTTGPQIVSGVEGIDLLTGEVIKGILTLEPYGVACVKE